jgi:prevent-host-death family protein
MKRVKIAELKDHLSQHLRAVERGTEVVVTDRDRPIARIVPMGEAEPRIVVLPARRPFTSFRSERFAPARWDTSSIELLLEERQGR